MVVKVCLNMLKKLNYNKLKLLELKIQNIVYFSKFESQFNCFVFKIKFDIRIPQNFKTNNKNFKRIIYL